MDNRRRRFLLNVMAVAGAVAVPASVGRQIPQAAASTTTDGFLTDLAVMLRSKIPFMNTAAALAQKHGKTAELHDLCRDLVRTARSSRQSGFEERLAGVFEKHSERFTPGQYDRIRQCLREGRLDDVA